MITIPTTENPFECYFEQNFETSDYQVGHGSDYNFAYLNDGESIGLDQNMPIGVNPLFSRVFGPIVWGYPKKSMTEDDVKKIIESQNNSRNFLGLSPLSLNFEDKRLFFV